MLAWHYTTGTHFVKIVEPGELRPTDSYIPSGEKPILWFSMEQDWEPTATKAWRDTATGVCRTLTRWETLERAGGLVRFGVDPSQLVAWPKLARLARMSKSVTDGLTREGLRQAATPTRWLGTLLPIPREGWKSVEVWEHGAEKVEIGSWVRVDFKVKGR